MRLLEIVSSPFAAAEAVPVRLTGREALSELSHFETTVLVSERSISPKTVLGKGLSVQILPTAEADGRIINGIISAFKALGRQYGSLFAYQFTIRPSFYLTTLSDNCRIFQDKTLASIVETVLSKYAGKIDYALKIQKAKKVREYCVQYNESDFDFLSRLLAEDGCFYFTEYAESTSTPFKHRLVISDDAASYVACAQKTVKFRKDDFTEASIEDWRTEHSIHTGEWRLGDYNPLTPPQNLEVLAATVQSAQAPHAPARYRGHGRYGDRARGEFLAGIALDREEALTRLVMGSARYHHFQPGAKVKFDPPPDDIDTEEVVFVSVEHDAKDLSAIGETAFQRFGSEGGDPSYYRNTFTGIPSSVAFRPPVPPAAQRMRGLQAGVVVGKAGEDINTDQHGRIKVRFHWDRVPKDEPSPTCWMFVAQTWAGNGFGAQFIPRIGMEVLIDFLEGDPDRPIVVGCVYNGDNALPFKPPGEKTRSGWRSISSPADGAKKINEIRFEDKAGSEEIFVHAGKDHTRHVANIDKLTVDNEQTETIKNDRSVTITKGNDTLVLKEGKRLVQLDTGGESLHLKQGDYKIDVDQGNHDFKLKGNYKLDISAGDQSTKLAAGASTLVAATKIEFKVGPTVVTMDPSGITIKAPMVTIEAQAKADLSAPLINVKAQGAATLESAMTKVSGTGMLMLKGGIIMIN